MIGTRVWVPPLVAAGIVALAFVLPGRTETPRAPHSATVTQSTYACPATAAVVTGRFVARPRATATAELLPAKTQIGELAATGGWNAASVAAGTVVVTTTDADGSGPVGFAASLGSKAAGGGLSVESCPGVVHEAWYVGAGSGMRHFSTVTLTNLSNVPAVARIQLWSLSGPVDAINADAVVLRANQTRRVRLDALAAGEPQLAMRVTSQRGALSVAVRDTSTAVFAGTEAMAPTRAPARVQLLSGLAAGAERRQLQLLNPGEVTARVKVEVLGKGGALVPAGLESVKAAAGRITSVELPKSVGQDAAAVRLTSDQPLAAAVRIAGSNKDFAYAVGAETLSGPAVAPVRLGTLVDGVRLDLTAPAGAAEVVITAYDRTMTAHGSTSLRVAAGSTASLDLARKNLFAKDLDDLAYVAVVSRGEITGSMVYTAKSGLSVMPLRAAPLTELAPDVRPVG